MRPRLSACERGRARSPGARSLVQNNQLAGSPPPGLRQLPHLHTLCVRRVAVAGRAGWLTTSARSLVQNPGVPPMAAPQRMPPLDADGKRRP